MERRETLYMSSLRNSRRVQDVCGVEGRLVAEEEGLRTPSRDGEGEAFVIFGTFFWEGAPKVTDVECVEKPRWKRQRIEKLPYPKLGNTWMAQVKQIPILNTQSRIKPNHRVV